MLRALTKVRRVASERADAQSTSVPHDRNGPPPAHECGPDRHNRIDATKDASRRLTCSDHDDLRREKEGTCVALLLGMGWSKTVLCAALSISGCGGDRDDEEVSRASSELTTGAATGVYAVYREGTCYSADVGSVVHSPSYDRWLMVYGAVTDLASAPSCKKGQYGEDVWLTWSMNDDGGRRFESPRLALDSHALSATAPGSSTSLLQMMKCRIDCAFGTRGYTPARCTQSDVAPGLRS